MKNTRRDFLRTGMAGGLGTVLPLAASAGNSTAVPAGMEPDDAELMLVNPFFIGKDARDLDELIDGVFLYQNNYKYQGYTLWIPVATVEMAILDMLGRIAGKSMGELIGDIHTTEIAVYQANNNRGRSAEESIETGTSRSNAVPPPLFRRTGSSIYPGEWEAVWRATRNSLQNTE